MQRMQLSCGVEPAAMEGVPMAVFRELGRLEVNFHASSGPARAHCCLTDEQVQDATRRGVMESARMRQLCNE